MKWTTCRNYKLPNPSHLTLLSRVPPRHLHLLCLVQYSKFWLLPTCREIPLAASCRKFKKQVWSHRSSEAIQGRRPTAARRQNKTPYSVWCKRNPTDVLPGHDVVQFGRLAATLQISQQHPSPGLIWRWHHQVPPQSTKIHGGMYSSFKVHWKLKIRNNTVLPQIFT